MKLPCYKESITSIGRRAILIVTILCLLVLPAFGRQDNTIEMGGQGTISITAINVPLTELLQDLQRKTDILLYIVDGWEEENFSGHIQLQNVGEALSYLLKEKSYAVIYNDPSMNNRIETLKVGPDRRFQSDIGKSAEKWPTSKGIRVLETKPDRQRERDVRLSANDAKTTQGRKGSKNRPVDGGLPPSSRNATVTPFAAATEQMGYANVDGKGSAGGGMPFDVSNDRSGSHQQREEWLLTMIKNTERRLDSGYSDRIYENQVSDSGSEDGIMHDSEWLTYYEKKLADLRAGQ